MLVIIPARRGSKGLPQKNIKECCGKPLIQYTIEGALAATAVSRILVSTDDPEVISIVKQFSRIEVPFVRPATLAEDTTSAIDVYLHVVDWLKEHEGNEPENLCVLLPTSPLRLPSDIDNCISLYNQRQADVVVSVQEAKPIHWHQNIGDDGRLYPFFGPNGNQAMANRQELGPLPVVLNGSIYVLNVLALRQTQTYFGPNSYGYIMPASRSVDIDSLDDFHLATALLAQR